MNPWAMRVLNIHQGTLPPSTGVHIKLPCNQRMKFLVLLTVSVGIFVQSHCCSLKPGGRNIAWNGVATQSSQADVKTGSADVAIDGFRDGNYFKGSCTHSIYEKNPWWKLDLKTRYKIDNVIVANRKDCCPERLKRAEIRIGDSPDNNNPVCGIISDLNYLTTFCCNGMVGRYVSVVIPGKSTWLTLCEVEVYGETAPIPAKPTKPPRPPTKPPTKNPTNPQKEPPRHVCW
ncbi:fucolectin-like [Discoglossus pictus]